MNESETIDTVPAVAAPGPSRVDPGARAPHVGRVSGIDGLRAVAALWVVLFHMRAASGGSLWPGVDLVVRSGSTGVSLFLLLSGLCLYLPYAGGRLNRFRGRAFFGKRVRRLLPAYYASLVLILIAQFVANGRFGLPLLSGREMAAQSLTHVTLTHQLFPETFYGLNGGYWSLGLEWELYLTLPLLIILAVRFGLARTVAGIFAVTAAYRLGLFAAIQGGLLEPHGPWASVVLPNQFLGRWSEFALGMVAAELLRTRRIRVGWPLMLTAVVAAAVALALPDNPLNHMLFGVFFFTLVSLVLAGDNPVAAIFSWRPLVAIGVMSYSLYLVHQPLIGLLAHSVGVDSTTDPREAFTMLVLLLPLILVFAFGFFVAFEKRTLMKPGQAPVSAKQLMLPPRDPEAAPDEGMWQKRLASFARFGAARPAEDER